MPEPMTWDHLPSSVHDAITAQYGRVDNAEAVPGPGPEIAARVYAHRDDAFVKAVPLDLPETALAPIRREMQAAELLPRLAPAPRLLWQAQVAGYQLLGWELINDQTRHADLGIGSDELPFVLDVLGWLAEEPRTAGGRSATGHYNRMWAACRTLLNMPAILPRPDLYETALDRFDVAQLDGDHMVHTRLGRRTILVRGTEVFVVGWREWCRGQWWLDLASIAPHFIAKGHAPKDTDDLLRAAAPRWPDAPAEGVAGLSALVALHHRYQAECGTKERSQEQLRLAVAGHDWLSYWMADRMPARL